MVAPLPSMSHGTGNPRVRFFDGFHGMKVSPMTARIIPFPSHRFSAVDADILHGVESTMIAIGVWGRVQYLDAAQGPGFDMVLIYSPDALAPNLIIKRQKTGVYMLIDSMSMEVMATAKTLDDLLAPLEPVIRVAETAPDSGVRRLH